MVDQQKDFQPNNIKYRAVLSVVKLGKRSTVKVKTYTQNVDNLLGIKRIYQAGS